MIIDGVYHCNTKEVCTKNRRYPLFCKNQSSFLRNLLSTCDKVSAAMSWFHAKIEALSANLCIKVILTVDCAAALLGIAVAEICREYTHCHMLMCFYFSKSPTINITDFKPSQSYLPWFHVLLYDKCCPMLPTPLLHLINVWLVFPSFPTTWNNNLWIVQLGPFMPCIEATP